MVLALINNLRASVSYDFATAIYKLADFFTALTRIVDFLQASDFQRCLNKHSTPTQKNTESNKTDEMFTEGYSSKEKTEKFNSKFPSSEVLMLSNVTSLWNCNDEITALKDISLKISKNELVMITGPVGCGKSALIGTILGELNIIKGTLTNPWNVAFVPQCPWIFTGSIRENILFGKSLHEASYHVAIEASKLNDDLENLPDGDLTVVGERGVALSGGQRSRVSLARALYLDADLYLLDDPLSAVDGKVGKQLFEDCICGVLNNKTRVLVTHQQQYVKRADRIVLMNAGKVVVEGSYKELTEQGVEFEKMDFRYDNSSVKKATSQNLSSLDEVDRELMDKCKGIQIHEEDRMVGTVSWRLYWKYFRAGLSVPGVIALISLLLLVQGA